MGSQPASLPSATQGTPGDTMEQLLLSSPCRLVKPPLAEALLRGTGRLGKQAATVAGELWPMVLASVPSRLIRADPWPDDLLPRTSSRGQAPIDDSAAGGSQHNVPPWKLEPGTEQRRS